MLSFGQLELVQHVNAYSTDTNIRVLKPIKYRLFKTPNYKTNYSYLLHSIHSLRRINILTSLIFTIYFSNHSLKF